MKVIIDGVIYVPLMESNKNLDAIVRGLIYNFWGELEKNVDLQEKIEGLRVRVFDDELGDPIEEVIANIARELNKNA